MIVPAAQQVERTIRRVDFGGNKGAGISLAALAVFVALAVAAMRDRPPGPSPNTTRSSGAVDDNNAGIDALKRRDYRTALTRLRAARARDPNNDTVKANLLGALNAAAVAAMEARHHEEAERLYGEALALDRDDERTLRQFAVFLNNRAVASLDERRMDDARRDFARALPYLPRLADASVVGQIKTNYSNFLSAEGDDLVLAQEFERARTRYTSALEYNPDNANAHAGLADILYDQDTYAAALENYNKALAAAAASGRTDLVPDLNERIDTLQKEMAIEADFLTIRDQRDRFQLFFPKTLPESLIARVLATLNAAYLKVGSDFAFHPKRPVTVKIYSRAQLAAIGDVPPWVMGLFDGKLRLIDERLNGGPRALRRSIFHEYTHAVVHFLGRESVPSWLHEGLAQLQEPDNPIAQRDIHYVAVRVRIGKTVSLEELAKPFRRDAPRDEMPLIYLQSKLVVSYLLEIHGWEKMRFLLHETGRLDDFDKAFATTFGVTPPEMEEAWKQWILQRDKARSNR